MNRSHLPRHIGFIPDGNRRWAAGHGLPREQGYRHGIAPGLELFELCRALQIPEVSVYGFTQDNTRRPTVQTAAFSLACVEFALQVSARGAALLVLGDERSALFPSQLRPYLVRQPGDIKVNFLINYGCDWDLAGLSAQGALRSHDVSTVDMVVRWGGGCRLSGFLPVQCAYADIYVVQDKWPDFTAGHLADAMAWFARQDRTLGG